MRKNLIALTFVVAASVGLIGDLSKREVREKNAGSSDTGFVKRRG